MGRRVVDGCIEKFREKAKLEEARLMKIEQERVEAERLARLEAERAAKVHHHDIFMSS